MFWGVGKIPGVKDGLGGEKIKNSRYYLSRLYFASEMFELAGCTVDSNLIFIARDWMRRLARCHALVCSLRNNMVLAGR